MFVYCITPNEKFDCKFIKVGICKNIITLKTRYITYYGENCIYYYVKVKNRKDENNIHKELKKLGLHLENELFILNNEYDFRFYVKLLKHFNLINFNQESNIDKDDYILKKIVY